MGRGRQPPVRDLATSFEPAGAGEPTPAIVFERLQAPPRRPQARTKWPGPVQVVVDPDPLIKAAEPSPFRLSLAHGRGFISHPAAITLGPARYQAIAKPSEPPAWPSRSTHRAEEGTHPMSD